MPVNNKMDAGTLYIRIGQLIQSMPDLVNTDLNSEMLKWLGNAYAIVATSGDSIAPIEIKLAIDALINNNDSIYARSLKQKPAQKIQAILYMILSIVELRAPAAIQGNFIPVGNVFDVMAAILKVLNKARNDILIIDPYLDEKVLMDFAIATKENITIRLLADQKDRKSSLEPAFRRWVAQYGDKRPLELTLATYRTVHDRLIIIDNSEVWVLTQSLNAFAERSPASIVVFKDPVLKIEAYDNIWQSAVIVK